MAFVKIEYGSSHNIRVQGTDYIEIHPDNLDDDGSLPPDFLDLVWQEAVNDFMNDTTATIVDNEGD